MKATLIGLIVVASTGEAALDLGKGRLHRARDDDGRELGRDDKEEEEEEEEEEEDDEEGEGEGEVSN